MSVTKYPSITVSLEDKIRQGIYRGKMPTTRELAVEFATSRQTITNALRPLVAKKMLIPEGRRGVRINKPRSVEHGMIGIITVGKLTDIKNDPALHQLQQLISNDGFESVLLSISSTFSFKNICAMLSNSFSGLIFAHSSLTLEIAEYLENKKIPFVSCNRLPVYPRLNFVEHDWENAVKKIARHFAEKGYSRQGLFFYSELEGYNYLIRKQWINTKIELNLPVLEIDQIKLNPCKNRNDSLWNYLKALRDTQQDLQLFILWQGIRDEFLEIIEQFKLREHCIIVGPLHTKREIPDQTETFAIPDDYNLLLEAYHALRELILAPSDKLIHRLVDYPIIYNK